MMKKIYTAVLVLAMPALAWGQSIDISGLASFDISEAVGCDSASVECQAQIEQVQTLLAVLLQQLIVLEAEGVELVSTDVQDKTYIREYQTEPDLRQGRKKTFYVEDGEVEYEADTHAFYKEIIRMFETITPEEFIENFTRVQFVNDEDAYYAGRVEQEIEQRGTQQTENWELKINIDDLSLKNRSEYNEAVELLAHEIGHVLLTNHTQLDFFVDEEDCSTLYIEDLLSCAKDASYYAALEPFWSDDYIEWTEEYLDVFEDDQEEAEEMLEEYYEMHKDEFVSEYAATSVHEDAAELIAHFAVDDVPTGLLSIAEEKIITLLEFSEMQTFRSVVQSLLK